MLISDFIEILEKNSDIGIELETLPLPESLVDRVKINTDTWGSSSALNVHAAQYMQAVQKDVLLAWNTATGQHVTLSNLDYYPFLIVEFEVHDGCIDFKQIIKLSAAIMKDLSPKQKMCVYTMLFCGVLAVSTAYTVGKLADSGFFDSDEIKKIKIISQQKESTKVLINNLGNGTVTYQGSDWNTETLKNDRKSVALVSVTENVAIDGIYYVDICKLEGGLHLIAKDGRQFNADYDALTEDNKKILTNRLAVAMLEKKKLEQTFRIDAKLKDGTIIKAHIIDIDNPPRPHASKLVLKQTQQNALKQGSLLEEF